MDINRHALANRLSQALEATPFHVLGPQPSADGYCLRVYQPQARRIDVLPADSQRSLGLMTPVHPDGLFELLLPECLDQPYRLHIESDDGHGWTTFDPYQFVQRSQTDFDSDHLRIDRNLGAQCCQAVIGEHRVDGVRFALWAPAASSVSVIGHFNDWDVRRHPMQRHDDGIWRLFIPGLVAGDDYKFALTDAQGNRLPHKADPVGFQARQFPQFNSVITDPHQYTWQDSRWCDRSLAAIQAQPMSIYEVHVGSWKRPDGQPLTYRQLADQLIPYALDLGFTHLEFLPLMEHPYDGSWGYQPLGLFAPTSRYGTPDDFKYLVDQCHQAGLGVILDWVPAHFPADEHGLARFDGSPLYEDADPQRGWHPDWQTYIYDFAKPEVRDFLIASALYWLDVFHIDALRVDAVASMLYLDYSRGPGEWTPNADGGHHNYAAIELLRQLNLAIAERCPRAFCIAEESTSFDGVTRPVELGGLGFDFKWNLGWMHDSLDYFQHRPNERLSHQQTLSHTLNYAFAEQFVLPLSHDEVVHGKGTLLTRQPGDDWQQRANLRLCFAWQYAHPGKKLNFMGNELAQRREWHEGQELDWSLLDDPKHGGIHALIRDLNRLYTHQAALHRGDGRIEGFDWLRNADVTAAVFSLWRCDPDSDEQVLVVLNTSTEPQPDYRLGVSTAGRYDILLNTDSRFYGGSDFDCGVWFDSTKDPSDDQPYSLLLQLPPLAALYIKLRRDEP
ncbi:1,4-alpha-glucan branching enzyme [Saccharospirillum sp. MSK14-1]|uniref:1,4-alpha-glucan branching protein GlgB n=1 Tax=Saccharospirillum sp. MSK14-1 TaxID=1897632 RepID=UPI000D35271B|nr:1,4-alpha-glucan branching protein GlgB [Saccharospirillum sp. MSK14-1]PTY35717.1 1,4-alpha-glucan branching enzyme [Saccharospirillum sp. MSK14-1]